MGASYGEIKERFEGLERNPTVQRIQGFCRVFSRIEGLLAEVQDDSAPASDEVVQTLSMLASVADGTADFPARVCDLMTKADRPGGTCGDGPNRVGDPMM